MKLALGFALTFLTLLPAPHTEAASFRDLLPYVQTAPDQGNTNTCWFVASTGVMELLLNRKYGIVDPEPGAPFDLSESYIIWQRNYIDRLNPHQHFVEEVVRRFNHGEAVHINDWPFSAFNADGSDNMKVWNRHPEFFKLPRLQVPRVKTELLFARGRKWAMRVLRPADIELMKKTMLERQAPLIVNYNDNSFWHVVVIVGFDDEAEGECYEVPEKECQKKGAFFVRDSNGTRFEARSYSWFLINGNAAALVDLE